MSEIKKPTVIICIGMAGSGKTTFMQRLNADLHSNKEPPYVINLDPAVLELPYTANIDIRDTVKYKEIMKQYNLGPNGAILTSLNLFTTKFDQVLDLLDKRSSASTPPKYVIIDTPGQIEIFTWSASGSIITEALAANYPTIIVYVVDTPRCDRPATFMSNMLYACSIMYKSRLPMVLLFNKTDEQSSEKAISWMSDVIEFQESLAEDPSYMSSLVQSMSLVLEEFYKTLRVASVSAFTGDGMEEFFTKLEEAREEFCSEYQPELERRIKERKQKESNEKDEQLQKFMSDLSVKDEDDA